jgi:hypothetical protein
VQLTMQLTPNGGGNTSPAPGTTTVQQNSVVSIKAVANPGFRFVNWSPNVTAPNQPVTTVFMDQSKTVLATFEVCNCAQDVTLSMGVTFGAFTLNPITGRYVQTVTLTNNSGGTITGPISLVLDNLSANASLFNATGTTAVVLPAGSPYLDSATTLANGQSVGLTLQFTNPTNAAITYSARVLAGPGSR